MSDLLSQLQSAVSNASSSGSQTQSDLLVESFKKTQQPKVDALNTKKKTLEERISFLNSLRSKVDSLNTQIDKFTANDVFNKFKAKSMTSSNTAVATVSSEGDAAIGVNSLFVKRLASTDSLITQRTNVSDSFGGSTSGTLKINGFDINVTFTGTETNEEALKKIVTAINNTEDITFTASYIKDTTTTGRLTFSSKETGESKKVVFQDSELAAKLGLTTAGLSPDSTARYSTAGSGAFYKTADPTTLNSNVTINGLEVVRESNSIDDLLSGVTINLLKPQDTEELPLTLTTSVGTTKVQDLIKPLLDSYNEIMTYIKSNPTQMRGDNSIGGLYTKLRSIPSQAATPLSGTTTTMLSEAGITANKDGTISVTDTTKLENALKDNPLKVANLFSGTDGLANRLNNAISNLVGSDGLLVSRSLSLSKQIDQTKQKTIDLQDKIERQGEALRKEYESTLRVFLQAQQQSNLLGTFPTSY